MRAAVLDDQEAQRRLDGIEEDPEGELAQTRLGAVGAAMSVLAWRRFTPDTDVRELAAWVDRLWEKLPEEVPFTRREAEAVLRMALGEQYLAYQVDREVVGESAVAVALQLGVDLRLSAGEIDALVVQSEELLGQLMAEGVLTANGALMLPVADDALAPAQRGAPVDWLRVARPEVATTQPRSRPAQWVKATLAWDNETRYRLLEQMRYTPETGQAMSVLEVVCRRLARLAFARGRDLREVTATMAWIKQRYRMNLPLMHMDAVTRAALGEPAFVADLSLKDRAGVWTVVSTVIVREAHLSEREVDGVVADAERQLGLA
ncbi:MAG: hypothetical protein J2P15_04595 [Micromonosporaceae bacterium]|nr:hypothetical protein [Micromonosporaceae bacterium]